MEREADAFLPKEEVLVGLKGAEHGDVAGRSDAERPR
jgi:hypothetical protein